MNNRERKSEFRKSEESRGRKCPGQTDRKEKPEAAEGAKTVASGKGPEEERKRHRGKRTVMRREETAGRRTASDGNGKREQKERREKRKTSLRRRADEVPPGKPEAEAEG